MNLVSVLKLVSRRTSYITYRKVSVYIEDPVQHPDPSRKVIRAFQGGSAKVHPKVIFKDLGLFSSRICIFSPFGRSLVHDGEDLAKPEAGTDRRQKIPIIPLQGKGVPQ